MPIALTAAYDPGDLDAGTYTHVEVTRVRFDVAAQVIRIDTKYGTYSDPDFTEGLSQKQSFTISDSGGTDYTDLVALLSTASEPCVDAFLRGLLQWLLDKSHFAGTIA